MTRLSAVERRHLLVDGALAVAVVALVCVEYAHPFDDGFHGGDQRTSLLLSILTVLPLAVRRLAPLAALTTMCAFIALPAVSAPYTVLYFGGVLPVVFGVYTVARHRPPRAVGWAVAIVAVTVLVAGWRSPQPDGLSDLLFLAVLVGLAAGIGALVRRSADRRAQLATVLAELEQQSTVRARLAVLQERTSVARDLHDLVAHAVSLMLVQAGAARLAIDDAPAEAAEFLERVEQAGAGAEQELNAMVRALRGGGAPPSGPTEGLAGVAELVERMRAAGLQVRLTVRGEAPALPAGLDVSAFRIVQEALTNALKHGGPTSVQVVVTYGDEIIFEITDQGPAGVRAPAPSSGQGLVGMAERVALFGGELDYGRRGTGWGVRVRLPVGEPA